MTPERRKSIIALAITLAIGIFLGLLIPPAYHLIMKRERPFSTMNHGQRMHRNMWFVGMIDKVVRPDSVQAAKLKPITDWASSRIDSIEQSANAQMAMVFDSVKVQIKPILTEEQQQRLDNFHARAQSKLRGPWHGRKRGNND